MTTTAALMVHRGGCHCGDVRFEFEAPALLQVLDCNCSICSKAGFLHYIVPGSRFRLLTDPAAQRVYTFNTGTARHLFCGRCGIKSYYVPRSNPDGFDINVRCLDPDPQRQLEMTTFDGQNWETGGAELAGLSKS